ncbi:MAG: hypothetical protein ACRCWF_06165 [Beijerinckiaceae bacterium]
MSGYLAPQESSHADYEAIELAVMETDRGRNFLQEYARRNRHADTQVLLSALSRIEKSIAIHREPTEIDKFRLDVLEMSRAISRTRAEISSIKPENEAGGGRIVEASGELDSIVAATESATSDILASAEKVQEAAWTMREAGGDPGFCDMLDERATEIYTSCSFQDLTAQRIRKVIDALGFLEKRVNTMIDIWEFAEDAEEENIKQVDANAGLVRDPSMSQADVDFVLVEETGVQTKASAPIEAVAPSKTTADVNAGPAFIYSSDVSFAEETQIDRLAANTALKLANDAPEVALLVQDQNPHELDMSTAIDKVIALSHVDGFAADDLETRGIETHDLKPVVGLQAAEELQADAEQQPIRNRLEPIDEIDDILFSPQDALVNSAPVAALPPADHLKLVSPPINSLDAITKARSGEGLTAEEAAQAMDALKKMSVEERTRLFS